MKKRSNEAQQEMVGFVLIVIIVVVALMVFLVISIKKPAENVGSKVSENLLSSLMMLSTDCSVSASEIDNVEDLIKDCYDGDRLCKNLNMRACGYLNESLVAIMADLADADNNIESYDLNIFWTDDEAIQSILLVKGGECNQTGGAIFGATRLIRVSSGNINVQLNICNS